MKRHKKGTFSVDNQCKTGSCGLFVNALLGVGLALCGLFLGRSLERSVSTVVKKNFVSVKGLVDNRMIKADHANMYFRIEVIGDEADKLVERMRELQKDILAFCSSQGIKPTEMTEASIRLNDRHKDFRPSKYNTKPPEPRYEAQWSITFDSDDVEKIRGFHKRFSEYNMTFLKVGNVEVNLASPHYAVYNLDAFRAGMIADATKSARKAADQFAQDSGCKVGAIRQADQGTLSLDDVGDGSTKRARLVSYVDFYLDQ